MRWKMKLHRPAPVVLLCVVFVRQQVIRVVLVMQQTQRLQRCNVMGHLLQNKTPAFLAAEDNMRALFKRRLISFTEEIGPHHQSSKIKLKQC